MKSGVKSVWLQKNPNVITESKNVIASSSNKKINNKRGKKGIECPNCPK